MKLLTLSIVLFTLNCQTSNKYSRSDWNLIITSPKSIPNPSLRSQPYEFEDENVFISIGPYIGSPRSQSLGSYSTTDDLTFIIYNKTNSHIIIDFDDSNFINPNGYIGKFITDRNQKVFDDTIPIRIPPKTKYLTYLITYSSPKRRTAIKKLYLGEKIYSQSVKMSFPIKINGIEKDYIFDIMLYFREKEKDNFNTVSKPIPVFLINNPRSGK